MQLKNNFMKSLSLLLFLIAQVFFGFAQDKLVMSDGDTVHCRIVELGERTTRFQVEGRDATTVITNELLRSYRYADNWIILKSGSQNGVAFVLDTMGIINAESRLHLAGDQLKKSASVFYVGAALTLVGALLGGASTAMQGTPQKVMLYSGVGLGAVGSIISITAFIPIGRAGIELKKIKFKK